MSPTMKDLGIDQLSIAERISLVQEIWDSIAAEANELPLTEAQRQDLRRRIEAYEANRKAGESSGEVKNRLEEKPKQRPGPGICTGMVTHIAPDFDEPLEDMKEYME